MKNKKVVDLIVLDQYSENKDLKAEHWARINTWLEWMDRKLDRVASDKMASDEQQEYFAVNHLLRNFLAKRLQWVLENTKDPELLHKYLLVLPPFNQQGNIKSFLLHFFKLRESPDRKEVVFDPLTHSESEVRILWDLYKLTKTLDTVNVLKKSVSSTNPFPSQFSNDYIRVTLDTMDDMLNLLIRICAKPEHHQEIRHNFPPGVFEPEAILNRAETDNYLINLSTIEKFDYRNYFFHVYFKSSMKAHFKGKELTYQFNYLDFEILRQEFLMHWLNSRLKNNPAKKEVLSQYKLGDRSFSEVIEKNPKMEMQLLRKLPGHVFNDLIAQVNEAVDDSDKTAIDPMSRIAGEFAKQFKKFGKAKEVAQKSVEVMKEYVSILKKTVEKSFAKTRKAPPIDLSRSSFTQKVLKNEEIETVYFDPDDTDKLSEISIIEKSMSETEFKDFDEKVGLILSLAGEGNLIKRYQPRQEWVVPFLLKEKMTLGIAMHLLILGVEISKQFQEKDDSQDAGSDVKMSPFFVYGSKTRNFDLGETLQSRTVMEKPFFIYDPTEPKVAQKVIALMEVLWNELKSVKK